MSSINKVLRPLVIGGKKKPPSVKELDKLREKFEEITSKVDDSVYQRLPSQYTYSAKPYVFPILKKNVVRFERNEGDITQIPQYIAENEKLLDEAYNGCKVGDNYYSQDHKNVVYAKDVERWVFKNNAIPVAGKGYVLNKSSTTKVEGHKKPAFKGDILEAYDTGDEHLKYDLYEWKGSDGEKRYYRFTSLSPDAPVRRVHFNEAQFPEPHDIQETRVGIELEYSEAVKASREALKNKNYRTRWNSVHDGSIPREGTEFVSVPFRKDELPVVEDFMQFCDVNGARINKSCGYHVHVGSPNLDFVSLTSVVLFCENIQEDLFKLVPSHRQDNRYCKRLDESFRGFKKVRSNNDEKKVGDIFYEDAGTNYSNRSGQSKHAVSGKRHYWLSIDRFFRFKNEPHKRTVEFRMHHATHDTEEFMQFVLMCYYIVEFGINVSIKQARNATLREFIDWIPNRTDQQRIENMLTSKKVFERAV